MKRIAILGAGTAGTIMANRLHKKYRREIASGDITIIIVDLDGRHVYQPGLLFIPFDVYRPADTIRERKNALPSGVEYIQESIDRVMPDENRVCLENGEIVEYDVLVVATGSRVVPEETEGLTGVGWGEKMFEFYTQEGAEALAPAMRNFQGGKLVLNITEMPIKCPIAPLEFVFLSDWYFRKRGIRNRVEITLVTPLDAAFTRPLAATAFGGLLKEKGINIVTDFNTGEVDGARGELISYDERKVDFDLLVSIPIHMGAEFVQRSPGLGDDMNWVFTDPQTLQSKVKPNVFCLGDATNLATSKAGSVAHFESEILESNIDCFLNNELLAAEFDGHANCFIETGFQKAVLIDFNYDTEPLPGKFPFPVVGPLSLLRESRLNHLGKMAFKWIYWNVLLPGRGLPGVSARMSLKGKHKSAQYSGKQPA